MNKKIITAEIHLILALCAFWYQLNEYVIDTSYLFICNLTYIYIYLYIAIANPVSAKLNITEIIAAKSVDILR